jgi:predicted 3-demethylubiquinone-9 3-methyltransferase (glyoxalase superfamily)
VYNTNPVGKIVLKPPVIVALLLLLIPKTKLVLQQTLFTNHLYQNHIMKNNIYPCMWMNGTAGEAAKFYCDTFGDGHILDDTPIVVTFQLSNQKFMALNGGPLFSPTPATSFYVTLENKDELLRIWDILLQDGSILMPLNTYPWSEQYGWIQDKYGVSWQLSLGSLKDVHNQKYVTTFMYCGTYQGKAQGAIEFYQSLFSYSKLDGILRYEDGPFKGQITHAQLILNDTVFGIMDSGVAQPFTFTEGMSNVISCDNQEEVDYYWQQITHHGAENMCGWCRDAFGVWWQVVPKRLEELMRDPKHAAQVNAALMRMKKIDIATLEAAAGL